MPPFGPGTGVFSIGASRNSFDNDGCFDEADFDESTAATEAALLDVLLEASEAAAELSRTILSEDVPLASAAASKEGHGNHTVPARSHVDRRWSAGNDGSDARKISGRSRADSQELQSGQVAVPLVQEFIRFLPAMPYIPGMSLPLQPFADGVRAHEPPMTRPPPVRTRRSSDSAAASVAAPAVDNDRWFWDAHFAGLPGLLAVGAA